MTARALGLAGGAALLGVLAVPACGPSAVVPDPTGRADDESAARSASAPEDAVVLIAGEPGDRLLQRGSATAEVGTRSLDGGRVTVQGTGPGGEPALRFPSFSPDPDDYPRAVVTVTPTGPRDPLEPGTHSFVWGVDFRVDRSADTNTVDNGDNLVQRGLADDSGFFKAELDQRRPGCTVTGTADTLIVHASERVVPGRWYHLRCELSPGELAVYVTEHPTGPDAHSFASHISGFVGDVLFDDLRTPLTIGGKVGLDGKLMRNATDQFNGVIAAPYFAYL